MYLEDSNKKLSKFEDFENLKKIQEKDSGNFNIAFRFFKYFIISLLDSLNEVGENNYSISEKEINKIADNLVNNDEIWENIDDNITRELKKYEVETYKIGEKKINKDELKAIFNFVFKDDDIEMTEETLSMLLKQILNNEIYVTICEDERDLIWRLYIEDSDKQDLIENFEFILEKAKEGFDYKEDERVLEYGNRFFIIQY